MDRRELRPLLREKFPRERSYLLPSLDYLQEEFGYLPGWAMEVVGWHLHIPAGEVYRAATRYTELRTVETGRHLLRVCTGLSCWMNDSKGLLDRLKDKLSVSPGETTPDGQVTLEVTPCILLCAVGPAVELDGKWHGRATVEKVTDLIHSDQTSELSGG